MRNLISIAHPWHGIYPGKEAPAIVRCFIEIPKWSKGKYELDKDSGILRLDRVLFSSVHYPANSLDSWQDAIARGVIHGDSQDAPRCGILESCQANSLTKD